MSRAALAAVAPLIDAVGGVGRTMRRMMAAAAFCDRGSNFDFRIVVSSL